MFVKNILYPPSPRKISNYAIDLDIQTISIKIYIENRIINLLSIFKKYCDNIVNNTIFVLFFFLCNTNTYNIKHLYYFNYKKIKLYVLFCLCNE